MSNSWTLKLIFLVVGLVVCQFLHLLQYIDGVLSWQEGGAADDLHWCFADRDFD